MTLELALPVGAASIALDVDRFDAIVASLGHEAGDEVLAALTQRLGAAIGPGQTLAHVGGHEFVVLCDDDRQAMSLAGRLVEAIGRPVVVGERELFLAAHAGIAFATAGASPATLMRDASTALQRAQRGPHGSVEVFDTSMRTQLVEQLRVERDLRRGIDDGELRITYQPVVSLRDGSVIGVEAFVRWAHPAWGLVAPARFLAVAEQSGLITGIGAWMLREACLQAARWSAAFTDRRPLTMTVNVSTQQLAAPGFAGLVGDALDAAGLPPRQLALDITEGAFHDHPLVLDNLHELRALGVRVILDDFVMGNARLSWLTSFPLDGLKLEAAFVGGLGTDARARPLLDAVFAMARACGIDVVAEGVETDEQAAILRALGCEAAQGYLFGRPVPAGRLEPLLASGLAGAPAAATPPATSTDATVTSREAADALRVSPSTVRRWADEGRLSATRTEGGHRRFRTDDVARLRRTVRDDGARVRAVLPPDGPLPGAAAALREHGARITRAGLKATYTDHDTGWFGAAGGRPHVERWLDVLSAALDSGAYAPAIDATAALTRRAHLGGATTMERVTFLERTLGALLRVLSESRLSPGELSSARRICAALRHRALEETDELARCG